jgi:hypothetical protein
MNISRPSQISSLGSSSIKSAITNVSGSANNASANSGATSSTRGEGGSVVKAHNNRILYTALTGWFDSLSRPPSGVQAPNVGIAPSNPNLIPQVGDGSFVKVENPPPVRATPKVNTNLDPHIKAFFKSILNDRENGGVTRDQGKIIEVQKENLDERTKQEIEKFAQDLEKSAEQLNNEIDSFSEKYQVDENLNKILNEVKEGLAEAGEDNYNPQKLFDSAEKLNKWIEKNPYEAKDYGESLTDLTANLDKVVQQAQKQIALYENNPATVLRAADQTGALAQETAENLKTQELKDFEKQVDATMQKINVGENGKFNITEAQESLDKLKKAYDDLPSNKQAELKDSFDKVRDLSQVTIDGHKLATEMEPSDLDYKIKADKYVNNFKSVSGLSPEEEEEKKEIVTEAVGGEDKLNELLKSLEDSTTEESRGIRNIDDEITIE